MSLTNSFVHRKPAVVLAAALVSFCLTVAATAHAAVDPGAACAASKQKAAAKKFSAKVKCHGVAIKKELAVDAECLSKAEAKFEAAFSKAEDKGGCATTGDVDDIELLVDNALAQLLAALPAAPEDCDNGQDDDGDGFVDCGDADCIADPACVTVEDCDNDQDDDADGFADCADADCAADPACVVSETNCTNAMDDDGDGFTDCDDSDCTDDPACVSVETNCGDNLDDDGDGFTDCADFDCAADPLCE